MITFYYIKKYLRNICWKKQGFICIKKHSPHPKIEINVYGDDDWATPQILEEKDKKS